MNVSVALVFPNFVAYWLIAQYLGGDALNGYARAGHYFLCAHGGCTEVTPSVWNYSYWHAVTAIGGIYLVFFEMALFVTTGDIALNYEKMFERR